MKGIILAGGTGSRLYPATIPICKQLLPVYDKPMIYYSLSVLMLAGIRDILIISTHKDIKRFEEIFGNGEQLGLNLSYAVQEKPRGIAEAIIIGESFIRKDRFALILGDNIFFGHDLPKMLNQARQNTNAVIFAHYVSEPERYGVVELDLQGNIVSIEEKPKKPKSNWVVTGLYFLTSQAVEIAKKLKPSKRRELEITDVIKEYHRRKKLNVLLLSRGYAWLDTGTCDSLYEASEFIRVIEKRQGQKIACVEEIAYRMGFIDKEKFKKLINRYKNSQYARYLERLIKE